MEFLALIGSLGTSLGDWVAGASTSHWSLLVLFLLCWGDGFFPPLPSGTLVSALGAAAISSGSPELLVAVMAIGSTGALAGDLTMVAIGRRISTHGNGRLSRLSGSVVSRAERHWTVLLSTSRFVPVLRVAVFLAAGARRVPLGRVLLLDGIAASTWACTYALSGALGGTLSTHPLVGMAIGILVGLVVGSLVAALAQVLQRPAAGTVDGTGVPSTSQDPPVPQRSSAPSPQSAGTSQQPAAGLRGTVALPLDM